MEPSFTAVWSRVTGSVPLDDERSLLLRGHQAAAEAARRFTAMAGQVGDYRVREALHRLAGAEERQRRKLAALYFLRTGERPALHPMEKRPRRPLPHFLREEYRQALERAESYERAAEWTPRDTAELCRALSQEERRHAGVIQALVERSV